MSRTENSLKNIYSGLFNKIVILIISFVSRKMFIDILGVGYLGINSLFTDILSLLSMADLGFGTAMAYSFYKPLAENDTRKISALISFYRKVYNLIAVIILTIGVSLIPFLGNIINLKEPIANLEIYYLVFLINTVVSYLFIYKSTILSADQKGYVVNKISTIISVTKILCQTVTLVLFQNYLIYILITVLFTLLNNIVISYFSDKIYPFIKNRSKLECSEIQEIKKNILSIFIVKFSSVLLTGTDNIIISAFIGTELVGIYSNYNMIVIQIVSFITIIFSSLTASIGNLIYSSDDDGQYRIFSMIQLISSAFTGIVIICFVFLINDFIILWLGKEFLLDSTTIMAILLNLFLQIALQPIWTFREATALYLKTKYIMLLTAAINIILSVFLVNYFGIAGVVFASFLSRILTYFWYEPRLLFKEYFNKSEKIYYIKFFGNVADVIILYLIITFIDSKIYTVSWIMLFLKGMLFTSICILYYFIRYRNTIEFKEIKNRIIHH